MALNSSLLVVFISSLLLSTITNFSVDAQDNSVSSAPTSSVNSDSYQEDSSQTETTEFQVEPKASIVVQPSQVEVHATVKKVEKNMMMTMQKTEDILKVIKKRLAATEGESRAEGCLKTCIEVYEEAIDGMKNSIEDLESGNYYKVNVDISAVSTDVETCEECYIEMLGEDPELKKFDEWVKGVTSECLGDLETVSA